MTPALSPHSASGDIEGLSSVAASLKLLKSFSENEIELGTTALARRLGVSKSTVHRLARTLLAEGFLAQNPDTRRYRLGIQLFSLGNRVGRQLDLARIAGPYLDTLRDLSQETTAFIVFDGADTVVLAAAHSPHAIQANFIVGERRAAAETCAGRLLSGAGLSLQKGEGCTKPVSMDNEMDEKGMRSLATLVCGTGEAAVGAMLIAGPASRFRDSFIGRVERHLVEAATAMSQDIGAMAI